MEIMPHLRILFISGLVSGGHFDLKGRECFARPAVIVDNQIEVLTKKIRDRNVDRRISVI